MVTKYDWKKGARGKVLEAKGSKSLQSVVYVRADSGILRELYEKRALYGTALKDAFALYGEPKK